MIFFANIKKSGDSSIKIFHQNEQQNKKIKKRCFFASEEERRQSRFFAKKYSFWRLAEKRKIFFQKPVGLDLDGQAERAKFACFFEFLNHNHLFFT